MSPSRKVDAACAAAVDVARAALLDGVPADQVGDHLGAFADGDRVVTHRFACRHPGYQGWSWAVTVARAPRARTVTVSETVLLPGPDALLPPPWVPYTERVRPGDVGPGDVLPTADDDPRLVPGYAAVDEDDAAVVTELGLGRPRVLSRLGQDEAAERWHAGDAGPASDEARTAQARCRTCGFLVRLGGRLGTVFGVCANEMSRSDGRVVSFDHGCGAHSEATVGPAVAPPADTVLDTVRHDALDLSAAGRA